MAEGAVNAEFIAVGTEILLGDIANSHARFLSLEFAKLGIGVYYHAAVGDHLGRIVSQLQLALERSQVIVITGGLGPTDDDLTRNAVAKACDLPLVYDEDAFQSLIVPYFVKLGRPFLDVHKRQAERIGDAKFLPNARGTAPGQYLEWNGRHLFLLPGPPLEMQGMYGDEVKPILEGISGSGSITSRVLHLIGIGESAAEAKVLDILQTQSNPTIAPLAGEGEMLFRITAKSKTKEEALALIAPIEKEITARLGHYIYGYDEDTLSLVVFRRLLEKRVKVGFAESCTGGLLSSMLVDIPGSSEVFAGSVIAYHNEVKVAQLGVSEVVLSHDGAVSEETAKQMAQGIRNRLNCDFGVSVTGIAGPTGGTADKPVGLVYVAATNGQTTTVARHVFPGSRTQVRVRAAKAALKQLLDLLNDTEVKI